MAHRIIPEIFIILSLFFYIPSYAQDSEQKQGVVCGEGITGIGYVLRIQNIHDDPVDAAVWQKSCVPANVGDIIRFWAYSGKEIGFYTVTDGLPQDYEIPLNGTLKAWGTIWYPSTVIQHPN